MAVDESFYPVLGAVFTGIVICFFMEATYRLGRIDGRKERYGDKASIGRLEDLTIELIRSTYDISEKEPVRMAIIKIRKEIPRIDAELAEDRERIESTR
jgi:hypothetical protein